MSAALEVLRAAQQGDREACEQAVLETTACLEYCTAVLRPGRGPG